MNTEHNQITQLRDLASQVRSYQTDRGWTDAQLCREISQVATANDFTSLKVLDVNGRISRVQYASGTGWSQASLVVNSEAVDVRVFDDGSHAVVQRGIATASDFDIDGSGTSPVVISLGTTPVSGSSLLVWAAADLSTIAAPTDNKGNTLTLVEQDTYVPFPGYGFRLYTAPNAAGGAGHTVSLVKTSLTVGESTLIAMMVPGVNVLDTSSVYRAAAGAGGDLVSATVVVPAG